MSEGFNLEYYWAFEAGYSTIIYPWGGISPISFPWNNSSFIGDVAFSPNGDYLAFLQDDEVKVMDIDTLWNGKVEFLPVVNPNNIIIPKGANYLTWYPGDENIFVVTSNPFSYGEEIMRYWVRGDNTVQVLPTMGNGNASCIEFSPDGKWFVKAYNTGTVKIYRVNASLFYSDLSLVNNKQDLGAINSISFSPPSSFNGSQLLAISSNDKVYIYCTPDSDLQECSNIGSWGLLMIIPLEDQMILVRKIKFTTKGNYLTIIGDKLCRVYYINGSSFYQVFDCDNYYNNRAGWAISSNPDGDIIFTGGGNDEWEAFRFRKSDFGW